MEFSYYPGCSLHSTAKEYDQSVHAVFSALQVELKELQDWNCCSASSAHSLNRDLSLALPARNLAIAQKAGLDVIMPCAACFNRHKTAQYALIHQPDKRAMVEQAVGFEYQNKVQIRPPLEVIAEQIGLEQVGSQVRKPLNGLKAVDYYGCLLVRPPEITQFENPEHPVLMAKILASLGAEVMPWSDATDCCGGGLALTKPVVAARLVNRLVERAREAGAQVIVTSCPLCQLNLEMRQKQQPLPIFYFTELMGLAFALPEAKTWWSKHLIDPTGLLNSLNLL
jgi:heterodisulfide reductase subunit B